MSDIDQVVYGGRLPFFKPRFLLVARANMWKQYRVVLVCQRGELGLVTTVHLQIRYPAARIGATWIKASTRRASIDTLPRER